MTEEMMSLFPCIDGMECEKGGSFTKRHGILLDVGANIGWYSIVAAHLGHNGVYIILFYGVHSMNILGHQLVISSSFHSHFF